MFVRCSVGYKGDHPNLSCVLWSPILMIEEEEGGPVILSLGFLQDIRVLQINNPPFFDSRWSDRMYLYFVSHRTQENTKLINNLVLRRYRRWLNLACLEMITIFVLKNTVWTLLRRSNPIMLNTYTVCPIRSFPTSVRLLSGSSHTSRSLTQTDLLFIYY
jgi:hypothetical protein